MALKNPGYYIADDFYTKKEGKEIKSLIDREGLTSFMRATHQLYEKECYEIYRTGVRSGDSIVATVYGQQIKLTPELVSSRYNIPNQPNLITNPWNSELLDYGQPYKTLTGVDCTPESLMNSVKMVRLPNRTMACLADITIKSIDCANSSFSKLASSQVKMACWLLSGGIVNWCTVLLHTLVLDNNTGCKCPKKSTQPNHLRFLSGLLTCPELGLELRGGGVGVNDIPKFDSSTLKRKRPKEITNIDTEIPGSDGSTKRVVRSKLELESPPDKARETLDKTMEKILHSIAEKNKRASLKHTIPLQATDSRSHLEEEPCPNHRIDYSNNNKEAEPPSTINLNTAQQQQPPPPQTADHNSQPTEIRSPPKEIDHRTNCELPDRTSKTVDSSKRKEDREPDVPFMSRKLLATVLESRTRLKRLILPPIFRHECDIDEWWTLRHRDIWDKSNKLSEKIREEYQTWRAKREKINTSWLEPIYDNRAEQSLAQVFTCQTYSQLFYMPPDFLVQRSDDVGRCIGWRLSHKKIYLCIAIEKAFNRVNPSPSPLSFADLFPRSEDTRNLAKEPSCGVVVVQNIRTDVLPRSFDLDLLLSDVRKITEACCSLRDDLASATKKIVENISLFNDMVKHKFKDFRGNVAGLFEAFNETIVRSLHEINDDRQRQPVYIDQNTIELISRMITQAIRDAFLRTQQQQQQTQTLSRPLQHANMQRKPTRPAGRLKKFKTFQDLYDVECDTYKVVRGMDLDWNAKLYNANGDKATIGKLAQQYTKDEPLPQWILKIIAPETFHQPVDRALILNESVEQEVEDTFLSETSHQRAM